MRDGRTACNIIYNGNVDDGGLLCGGSDGDDIVVVAGAVGGRSRFVGRGHGTGVGHGTARGARGQ